MRVPCAKASGEPIPTYSSVQYDAAPTWSPEAPVIATASFWSYRPIPTWPSSESHPHDFASAPSGFLPDSCHPPVVVKVIVRNHTYEAILGTLLGVAMLYILISSFIRPRLNFSRKTTVACCAHCRLAPETKSAASDANGKDKAPFEADDVTAPLLGAEKE